MPSLESRLLATAEDLCRRTGRRPREAFMRRAVSTAYYALFHALCRLCANELIGTQPAAARLSVYRALDHAAAKRALHGGEAAKINATVAAIGLAFADLQAERHRADYDPRPFRYYYDETQAKVGLARDAMAMLGSLSPSDRRSLAVLVLFKSRF